MEPHDFRNGGRTSDPTVETQGPVSPVLSCVSLKSDGSMVDPPCTETQRPASPVPSCVSMKSDGSMGVPLTFGSGNLSSVPQIETQRPASPVPSCVSMQSDGSMGVPLTFGSGNVSSVPQIETQRPASPVPSCVSMKSDESMWVPLTFGSGNLSSVPQQHNSEAALQIHTLVEGTGDLLLDTVADDVLKTHKTSMRKKYECLFEGVKTQETKTLVNRIYTQLYITEGDTEGVNEEHEILQMDKTLRKQLFQNTQISLSDIFKPVHGPEVGMEEENITAEMAEGVRKEDKGPDVPNLRTVLTKGIAGIGKTVSVQKFIVDWAEGKTNQDVDFMFVLPFRELNLIKHDDHSLHTLLCDFHPEIQDLDLRKVYDTHKVVFIFDGLDESRIRLNFSESEKVSDITSTSSVGVLMTNLIKGELLPSAHIWVTSRPAAANQIPRRYISRVTEIQGFTDPQKEEYFRKRIGDPDQAKKIISHIKTARSLHIMCHIPVFCWISATVLQQIMNQVNAKEIPTTLTEMYAHFLIIQTNKKQQKYGETRDRKDEHLLKLIRKTVTKKTLAKSDRSMILKLATLAFKQLMKGNVLFYEDDLRECGIDVTEASVYSGICTEIFREESVLHQMKIYCFVHLSLQEFLAAFYVFHCYLKENMEVLQDFMAKNSDWRENIPLHHLLRGAVDEALKKQNGTLDLFLRFLMGISLESNQRLLQGLLTRTVSSSKSIYKTVQYVTHLIQTTDLPTERSINLFLCLIEMKDQSLFREIQEYLRSEKHSEEELSAAHCSAIAYMLQMSEEVLDELDPKKYNTSEEGCRRLIPAISNCRRALLANCHLQEKTCENLKSILQMTNCFLRELDLSYNYLQDSGVKMLSAGLKCSYSKLEILRLTCCGLTAESCESLTSALQTENSLKELQMSTNDLQDSGVELLSFGLKSVQCKLETLRLTACNMTAESCKSLTSVLQTENSLKELELNSNDLQDSGVQQLSTGLENSHCKLEILRLSGCLITEEGCSSLASALRSNPSYLKELDLTYNHPADSGVKLLSDCLELPHCKLDTLRLDHAGEIRIRPGLRKYACNLTLDPNTAYIYLFLSEENRKVRRVEEQQVYPRHPKRFDVFEQVLCRESLSGCCYWEAEWSGWGAEIAMTYKRIKRKGRTDNCRLGYNDMSWRLYCSNNSYSARHNKIKTVIPTPPSSSNRVGVYLDWLAGTLSFYSISSDTHTLTHLHTFHSTFTEPLYAGFRVSFDSSVRVYEVE